MPKVYEEKSIADYKREILLKKKIRKNPLEFLASPVDVREVEKIVNNQLPILVERLVERNLGSLITEIISHIPKKGEDGLDGRDGIDGKDGLDGKNGVDGQDGKDGRDGLDGKDGTEIEGKDIVKKVNALEIKPSLQIDAKHIKNLPKAVKKSIKMAEAIHRGGVNLIWNTVLEGTVNGSNTVFTLPADKPTPKDTLFIIEARGGIKSADNSDFTTSADNRTFTFTGAPPSGSKPPRIILYNA